MSFDLIKILIVEDEKHISSLVRISLSKAEYNCACAFDGVERRKVGWENCLRAVNRAGYRLGVPD